MNGSIRSPAASCRDVCSLLATCSSICAEATRESADPIIVAQKRHGPASSSSSSSILRNCLYDSETRDGISHELHEDALRADTMLHQLVKELNRRQTTHAPDHVAAKRQEETSGRKLHRIQLIPSESECANQAGKIDRDTVLTIMDARDRAHRLYLNCFGLSDNVLGSSGRVGQESYALRLFMARVSTMRSCLETALSTVLQQLFTEYATSDTRLRFRKPAELTENRVDKAIRAHEAGLLPTTAAAEMVRSELDGACKPKEEEADEQPAEMDAVVGDDAQSTLFNGQTS